MIENNYTSYVLLIRLFIFLFFYLYIFFFLYLFIDLLIFFFLYFFVFFIFFNIGANFKLQSSTVEDHFSKRLIFLFRNWPYIENVETTNSPSHSSKTKEVTNNLNGTRRKMFMPTGGIPMVAFGVNRITDSNGPRTSYCIKILAN